MSSYAKYNMDIANFSGGSGCWDSPATPTTGYGTTKAYLADTNLVTASNTSECEAATRFVGSIQLETPINVTSTTKTYGLTWSIEDKGLWVENDVTIHPSFVGSGPFLPIFTFE